MKLHYLFPFFSAAAPAVFLWEYTFAETTAKEAILAIGALLVFGGLVFALCGAFYRNSRKAAMFASTFLFLTLFFEQIFFNSVTTPFMKHTWAFFTIFGVIAALGYALKRTQKSLLGTAKVLTAVSGIFVLMSLVRLGLDFYELRATSVPTEDVVSITGASDRTAKDSSPDIYYIILDEYAAPSVIKNILGHEEAYEIVDWLEGKGFFVPKNSKSNYAATALSIPSSLNMRYLKGEEIKNKNELTRLTLDHALKDALKSYGYTYVHAGSEWVDYVNPYADINIRYSYDYLSPFQTALWQDTAFARVGAALDKEFDIQISPLLDRRVTHWYRVQFKFDEISKIPDKEDRPHFVFAHFLLPHVPTTFDAEGNYISRFQSSRLDPVQKYVGQVMFTNTQIKNLVETIMNTSKIQPIIIIQGDHGWRGFPNPLVKGGIQLTPEEEEALRLRIFNAYYLPDGGSELLYDSISPVNSFRVVLNRYFNQNLELLEDVSYGNL